MNRKVPSISEEEIRAIVADVPRIVGDPRTAEVLVKRADELGKKLLAAELKMAQVRDIFDELRQIESLWMRNPEQALRRLHLLQPKLAYRRARVPQMDPLAKVLNRAVQEVVNAASDKEQRERFQRLMEFAEAIVAYHKFYGGE